MHRYVLNRVFQALVSLFVISVVVFLLANAVGDPLHMLLPVEASKEQYELVQRELGLDKPLPTQYIVWLSNLARGDFGKSIRSGVPVWDLIIERLPNSIKLATAGIVFAILLGMPLGVIAALKKDSGIDLVAQAVAFTGMSLPSFWLGIMLIILFSAWLHWLPASGMGGPLNYLMPSVTLGWGIAAGIARLMRSSLLAVLDTEYIKLARIKGVSETRLILLHGLRNAVIPTVTFTGIYFGILIGMAVVVETVFGWPGIGRLAYDAVMSRDFPLIQGIILIIAGVMMAISLAIDILYAYIDPRIRY